MHWNDQVTDLRIQQTQCQKRAGNGNLWASSDYGLQYAKIDPLADEIAVGTDLNGEFKVEKRCQKANRDTEINKPQFELGGEIVLLGC